MENDSRCQVMYCGAGNWFLNVYFRFMIRTMNNLPGGACGAKRATVTTCE